MPLTAARPAYTDSHTRAGRRLGSPEAAALVAEHMAVLMVNPNLSVDALENDGFIFLGEGVSRRAFSGPDGCVYKGELPWHGGSNAIEVKTWNALLRHPDSRRFVPYHRIVRVGDTDVLIMERLTIDHEHTRRSPEVKALRKAAGHIGYYDTHKDNIGWRKGSDTPLLLDAGFRAGGDWRSPCDICEGETE